MSMDKWHRSRIPFYGLVTPPIAVGADKLLFDVFNATGSGYALDLRGLYAMPKLDVAVVGAVAVRGDLYRTSAIGTGGTATVASSATRDVAGGSVWKFDTLQPTLPASISGRVAPTGGATISHWLAPWSTMPEETNAASYNLQGVNLLPRPVDDGMGIIVRENSGILVKQGAVASVGSVAYLLVFAAHPTA